MMQNHSTVGYLGSTEPVHIAENTKLTVGNAYPGEKTRGLAGKSFAKFMYVPLEPLKNLNNIHKWRQGYLVSSC